MSNYEKHELKPSLQTIPVFGDILGGISDTIKFMAGLGEKKSTSEIVTKALKLGLTLSAFPVIVNALRSYFSYFDPDLFERKSLAKTENFPTVMFKGGSLGDAFVDVADVLYNQPILGSAVIAGFPYLTHQLSSGLYKNVRKKYLDQKNREIAKKYFREIQESIYLGKKLQKNELDFNILRKLDYNKRKELANHVFETYGVDVYRELGLPAEEAKTAQATKTAQETKTAQYPVAVLKLLMVAPTLVLLNELIKPFLTQQKLSLTEPVAKAVEAWEGVYLPEKAFSKMVPPARFFSDIEAEFEARPESKMLNLVLEPGEPIPVKSVRRKPGYKQNKLLQEMEKEEQRKELEEKERVNNLIEQKLEATAPSNPTAVKRRKVNIVTI